MDRKKCKSTMSGIVRINIVSDWNDWRVQMAKNLAPTADKIYRELFNSISMPLQDGQEKVECTKEEAQARYDWKEGIDCLLYFTDGTKATLQEKYLTFPTSTATFEEKKTSGEPGAWYYCTAQYYFIGYARHYKISTSNIYFNDWIMVDLPGLHRADHAHVLPWKYNLNGRDGRRASFRYLLFDDIPPQAVVSRYSIPEDIPF